MIRTWASLRSMAVLLSRAQEGRSREIPPQSPRGFSALARLYYLARPTKTAMLRRLSLGGHEADDVAFLWLSFYFWSVFRRT